MVCPLPRVCAVGAVPAAGTLLAAAGNTLAAADAIFGAAGNTLAAADAIFAAAGTTLAAADAFLAAAGNTLAAADAFFAAAGTTLAAADAFLAAAGNTLAAAGTIFVPARLGGQHACHDYRRSHWASPTCRARGATSTITHTTTRLVVPVPFPRRSVPGRRHLIRASQLLGGRRFAPGLGAQERRAVTRGVAADGKAVYLGGDPRPGSGTIPSVLFSCADAGVAHRHGLRAVVHADG
jgi:hypothetical protein